MKRLRGGKATVGEWHFRNAGDVEVCWPECAFPVSDRRRRRRRRAPAASPTCLRIVDKCHDRRDVADAVQRRHALFGPTFLSRRDLVPRHVAARAGPRQVRSVYPPWRRGRARSACRREAPWTRCTIPAEVAAGGLRRLWTRTALRGASPCLTRPPRADARRRALCAGPEQQRTTTDD